MKIRWGTVVQRVIILVLVLILYKIFQNLQAVGKLNEPTKCQCLQNGEVVGNCVCQFYNEGDKQPEVIEESETQHECLCYSDTSKLVGQTKVNTSTVAIETITKECSFLQMGGAWKPKHCKAPSKVAIIISYRDRWNNLAILLRHLHPILKIQGLDYRVFVVEQSHMYPFNRAKLFNVGVKEAQKYGGFDCFIFHDTDFIPRNNQNIYNCKNTPRHMVGSVIGKGFIFDNRTIPDWFFGGVLAMSLDDLKVVNGWSNRYWGWGIEDDDMRFRVMKARISYTRSRRDTGQYVHITHKTQSRNRKGRGMYNEMRNSKLKRQEEGLDTVQYEVLSTAENKLFTHLLIDVKMTEKEKNLTSLCDQGKC